jgi:hypothetical protein
VHHFYACALDAGGDPHGAPGNRFADGACFNAAVLDLDGNSVEVVFHTDEADASDARSGRASTRGRRREMLEWEESQASGNAASQRITSAAGAAARRALQNTSARRSSAPGSATASSAEESDGQVSAQRVLSTLRRSLTAGDEAASSSSKQLLFGDSTIQVSTKTLAGTLLGAAAGAAVAYAMCRSEEESARSERESASAALSARAAAQAAAEQHRVVELPAEGSTYSSASRRTAVRAIEAAPPPAYDVHDYLMMSEAASQLTLEPSARSRRSRASGGGSSAAKPSPLSELDARLREQARELEGDVDDERSRASGSRTVVARSKASTARSRRDDEHRSSAGKSRRDEDDLRSSASRSRRDEDDLRSSASRSRRDDEDHRSSASRSRRDDDGGHRSSAGKSRRDDDEHRSSTSKSRPADYSKSSPASESGSRRSSAQSTPTGKSKSRRSSASSARSSPPPSRASSRPASRLLDEIPEYDALDSPGSAPSDHESFLKDKTDLETVVPSDSISCVGLDDDPPARRAKSASGREKKRGAHRYSSRHLHEIEGSDMTVTPQRYRERSIVSIPYRRMPTY